MSYQVATENTQEAVSLILNAAVSAYDPDRRKELAGVQLALEAILGVDGIPAEYVLKRAFHRARVHDEDALAAAVDHAAMAFWNQLAACYPEISSGDLDAWADKTLFGAMTSAARVWLETNA